MKLECDPEAWDYRAPKDLMTEIRQEHPRPSDRAKSCKLVLDQLEKDLSNNLAEFQGSLRRSLRFACRRSGRSASWRLEKTGSLPRNGTWSTWGNRSGITLRDNQESPWSTIPPLAKVKPISQGRWPSPRKRSNERGLGFLFDFAKLNGLGTMFMSPTRSLTSSAAMGTQRLSEFGFDRLQQA